MKTSLYVQCVFWPVAILYLIAALLMKSEPVLPIGSHDEEEFYESYVNSRKGAADRILRIYQKLDRRIQRYGNGQGI